MSKTGIAALFFLSTAPCLAETVFLDAFDGVTTDMVPFGQLGSRKIENGSYVLESITNQMMFSTIDTPTLSDFSIETQVRVSGNGADDAVIVLIGRDERDGIGNYFGGITGSGFAFVGETLNDQLRLRETTTVAFSPTDVDVRLRTEFVGNEVSLYAWPADSLLAETAILSFQDDRLSSGSLVLVEFNPRSGTPTAELRFVQVSSLEDQGIIGDFDGNQNLDVLDIELLSEAIRRGNFNTRFDLTADSLVDTEDLKHWIIEIAHTYIGDSNLDGEFNSGDLVVVFEVGKYEQEVEGSWSEGDWDVDGRFGTSDLVAAFEDGGYEQGPRVNINAVPEPSSFVMLMAGLIGIAVRRRHVVA